MKKIVILNIAAAAFIMTGCVIAPPKIELTGERTMVERQIIGEYKEVESDSWAVASVKTNVAREKGDTSSSDSEMMKAIQIRDMNSGKIRFYKNEAVIGENLAGYIEYKKNDKYEKSAVEKKLLLSVIEEENKARKTIFTRSVVLAGKKPDETEIDKFGNGFANEQREKALKNDWVQDSNGTWARKR